MALVGALEEPYATLTLLLARQGLRIEAGVGVKLSDLEGNVLRIQGVIYDRKVYELGPKEILGTPIMALGLLERMRTLGAGTPVNPGNALKRQLHPAAEKVGMRLSGWRDFRHSFQTNLRKKNVHPKVISTLMGHAKVQLGLDVYDHADMQQALAS